MKRISVTLIVLISCLAIFSQETIDYLNVGKTIKFGKQKYSLAWSSHPTDYYYIQEWLPKGEAFDNYSQMFTVSLHFSEELTPLIAVQSKAAELDKRGIPSIIMEPLLVATAVYFCLCFPTSKLIAYFERRMSRGDKR